MFRGYPEAHPQPQHTLCASRRHPDPSQLCGRPTVGAVATSKCVVDRREKEWDGFCSVKRGGAGRPGWRVVSILLSSPSCLLTKGHVSVPALSRPMVWDHVDGQRLGRAGPAPHWLWHLGEQGPAPHLVGPVELVLVVRARASIGELTLPPIYREVMWVWSSHP